MPAHSTRPDTIPYAFVPVSDLRLGDCIHYYGYDGEVVGHAVDGIGLDGKETYLLHIAWESSRCRICPTQRCVNATQTHAVRLPRPRVIDWDEEDARAALYGGEAA